MEQKRAREKDEEKKNQQIYLSKNDLEMNVDSSECDQNSQCIRIKCFVCVCVFILRAQKLWSQSLVHIGLHFRYDWIP